MLVNLPLPWIIALNIAGWPVIHLAIAWLFTRLPPRLFTGDWIQPRKWESHLYTGPLQIRRWKHFLPDAAPWFRGFAKSKLQSTDPAYLRGFIAETRRGEAAHWAMLLSGGLFFLWNPPWADAVMTGYALAANLPCILTQRYNRIRLKRLTQAVHRAAC